jgi:hypothetical protein
MVAVVLVAIAAGLASSPAPITLAFLLVFAVALGIDLRVDRARLVPPLIAVVVAAASAQGTNALVAAPLVAVVSTWVARRARLPVRALIVGAGAGAAAACVARVAAWPRGSLEAVLLAIAAGFAFVVVTVVLGSRRDARASAIRCSWWSAPVLLVAALLAVAWAAVGVIGSALFGAGVALAVVGVAWWGAAPWGSRWLSRAMAGVAARWHRVAIGAAAVVVVSLAAATAAVSEGRATLALVTAAAVEIATAGALVAVRQWSFAPRRRSRALGIVSGVAVFAVLVYVPIAQADEPAAIPLAVALIALLAGVVWPVARLLDAGARIPEFSVATAPVDEERVARPAPPRPSA